MGSLGVMDIKPRAFPAGERALLSACCGLSGINGGCCCSLLGGMGWRLLQRGRPCWEEGWGGA